MLFKGGCFLVQIKSEVLVDKTDMQSYTQSHSYINHTGVLNTRYK